MVENELVPWVLEDVQLGQRTLEIGPGYGATLRALLDRTDSITAVEIDADFVRRLQRRYGDHADIRLGDGSRTGLPDNHFDSVVCFTMLHHVPTALLQDRLLAEAFRVLRPGGTFAGSDGLPGLSFRLKHIGDTYNPIRADDLAARLAGVGFADVAVAIKGNRQRWRAVKPGPR
jgi:SAM-dependent methyltransferase